MKQAFRISGSGLARRMLGAAAVVCTLTMTAQADVWSVVNLHPDGATWSYANGVYAGQQVGLAYVGGVQRASLWSNSAASWVDLNPTGATSSYANGVYGGKQVGWAIVGGDYRAGLWSGSAASWVDLTPAGAGPSNAVDAYGDQQVGYAYLGGTYRASLWTGTADSRVDLNPAESTHSEGYGVGGGQQVGLAIVGGVIRASLWAGSAASWVDLHPAEASASTAWGVYGGQQVGSSWVGDAYHASLWTGSAASWVDLTPAGATASEAWAVYGGQQVGYATVGGVRRASLWTGSAASGVDLHALLPSAFTSSVARGIRGDGTFTYVVGTGYNTTTGRDEALMWIGPVPEPASGLVLAAGLAALALLRRRAARGERARFAKEGNMPQRFCFLMMLVVAGLVAVYADGARANVVIDTVTVGNAGNAADTLVMNDGTTGYGGVGYTYNMGKYEVTAYQYTEFLNAVATTDTYGLYNPRMDPMVLGNGCNIQRSGTSGSYTYMVGNGSPADIANWGNRPVNFMSWGNAARFANWLHNDQPTGAQGLGTTEDGSYFLNGATNNAALLAVTRKANATWVIPSEDEWYKAAYHKNDGVTGNYWLYPTRSDTIPDNGNPGGDTGNSASYYDGDYTIGGPYWRTEVGFFSQSGSPYGTFDQGGNVWEWNEAVITGLSRYLRGGAYYATGDYGMDASFRGYDYGIPADEFGGIGFRVAEVPEPATLSLLLAAVLFAARSRSRKRPCGTTHEFCDRP